MERLNTILGRTTPRRQHPSEQQQTQETAPRRMGQQGQAGPAGQRVPPVPSSLPSPSPIPPTQPTTRYPTRELPGRAAPTSQRKAAPAQYTQRIPVAKPSSAHEMPETSTRSSMPTSSPSARPLQPRQQRPATHAPTHAPTTYQPAHNTHNTHNTPNAYSTYEPAQRESVPSRSPYPVREVHEPVTHTPPKNDYYYTDDYAPALHSDVLESYEEDEDARDASDAIGMQYGDWEEEESDVVIYQRMNSQQRVREHYAPARPYHDAPEVVGRTPLTRNFRELRTPISEHGQPAESSTPSTPPAPQAHVQEVPHVPHGAQYPRRTQPLHPQQIAALSREREAQHGSGAAAQHSRQVVPREQFAPVSVEAPAVTIHVTGKMVCPKCKGAGYLRADVPFGHPNFGKPIACDCKEHERREKRRQQLLELSDLGAFRHQSFHNFNTRFQGIHPSVIEAYEEAYHFAQNPNGWLVLMGPNGCGKTHLAAAIANQSLSDGAVVLFSVVPELLDHLRSTFAPSANDVYDKLFDKMREANVLVLDDLGAHQSTPWATEKLYQLLNYRYSWRMPTVITTNNIGLQAVDGRLRSRMMDNSLVITVNLERARDCRPNLARRTT